MIEVSPADVIVQMYTSGTTGHPKGVQLSHFSLYAHDKYRAEHPDEFDPGMSWNDWGPKDVSLVTMPVFHISGTGWGIVGLYNGARSIVLSQYDPGEVLSIIEKYGVTKLVLVPTAIHQLLLHPELQGHELLVDRVAALRRIADSARAAAPGDRDVQMRLRAALRHDGDGGRGDLSSRRRSRSQRARSACARPANRFPA